MFIMWTVKINIGIGVGPGVVIKLDFLLITCKLNEIERVHKGNF